MISKTNYQTWSTQQLPNKLEKLHDKMRKKNPNFDNSFITSFASNVGTPAMVIYAITSTGISFDI